VSGATYIVVTRANWPLGFVPPWFRACLFSALDEGEWSNVLSLAAFLLPGKEWAVPIQWKAGWAPEAVWTLWRRVKSFVHAVNRTKIRRSRMVPIPTTLFLLRVSRSKE
jgi:hypothetical protein